MSEGAGTSLTGALALLDRLLAERAWEKAESVSQQIMAQVPAGHPGWVQAQAGGLRALRGAGRLAEAINPPYAAGETDQAEALFDLAHAVPGQALPDLGADAGNASIHYVSDGYRPDPRMVMGRQAAGESFLRGWLQHAQVTGFHTTTRGPSTALEFAGLAARHRADRPVRWRFAGSLGRGLGAGALYQPDPLIADLAWMRRDARDFSLVGISHTLSSEAAMAGIAALVEAPVQPWDALICTSQAALGVVRGMLEGKCAALAERLGQPVAPPLPSLPIIPLGIDAAAFAPDASRRAALRAGLGIGPDDVVVLARGRICRDHKGHPLPLLRAVGLAAAHVPERRWHLVVAGWFADSHEEQAFLNWQPMAAPARVQVLDGRDAALANHVWSLGDIFVSLPDNVQETFGLTPVEAMAAGLPCVVSDWNGYKDTVREGIDGFRIRTWLHGEGGDDIATRLAGHLHPYRDYLREVAAACAIDIAAAAQALARLGADAGLRRQMGQAGQARARSTYDWSVIIPQYQHLFRDLAAQRGARVGALPHGLRPTHPDPLRVFGHYSTNRLTEQTRLYPIAPALNVSLWLAEANRLPAAARPDTKLAKHILSQLPADGVRLFALANIVPTADARTLAATVIWLAKGGLIGLES